MSAFQFQHNIKLPSGDLVNIQGDSEEEFESNLKFVAENPELLAAATSALHEAFKEITPGAAAAVHSLGARVVSSGPGDMVNTAVAAIPAQAGPVDGTYRTVVDRYQNKWEYNAPGAPSTPNGPAVKGTKVAKSGNPYVMWYDPAAGPEWAGPKIPKDAQWAAQFTR